MLRNGLYNFIGTGIRIGLGIITVPALVRLLGIDGYGIYSILLSVIAFAVLSEWSISLTLNVSLSQELLKDDKTKIESIGTTLLVSLIVIAGLAAITTLVLWYIAPVLPQLLKGLSASEAETTALGCRLLILIVWPRLLHQYFIGIEQAHNKYALLNIISTAYNIVQTIFILLMAWIYNAILPVLIAQIIASCIFAIIHAVICYRSGFLNYFSFNAYVSIAHIRSTLNYSGRVWLGTIGSVIFSQGDRLLIGSYLTPSAVGVYSALTSLAYQINSFSAAPVQPIMAVVSQAAMSQSQGLDKNSIISGVLKALLLNVLIAIGMGSLIILFSPEITLLIFPNSANEETVAQLNLITVICTLYSLNAVGYFILYAVKQETINTITILFCGMLSLTAIALLTMKFGLTGAIIGNSAYILTLFLLYMGLKVIKIHWRDIANVIQVPIVFFLIILVLTFITQDLISRCAIAVFFVSSLVLFGFNKIKLLLISTNKI